MYSQMISQSSLQRYQIYLQRPVFRREVKKHAINITLAFWACLTLIELMKKLNLKNQNPWMSQHLIWLTLARASLTAEAQICK